MRPILQRTKVKPTMKNLLLATAAVLALGACGQTETTGTQTETSTPAAATPTTEQVAAETARLNAWFDEKYEEELMLSPMTLTTLGRKERYDEIDDVSSEAQLEQLEWRRATTAEMQENFDYDLLDAEADLERRAGGRDDVGVHQIRTGRQAALVDHFEALAGIAGALVPICLKKLGQDPAQSSSIILTTVTDIAGFMSFLGIASMLSALLV